MKKLLVAGCALLVMGGFSAPAAQADTMWTVQNAQFGYWVNVDGYAQQYRDNGTISGSFTLDTTGNVTNFDLTTTPTADSESPEFPGWTYNNSTASVTATNGAGNPFTMLQFTTNGDAPETLSLLFVNNLLSGKTIGSGFSFLCTTANMDDQSACGGTPTAEFLTNGSQDATLNALNDGFRALSPPLVDPPACGGAACVTASPVAAVPEPGTLPLMLAGLVGLGFIVWRRHERVA